MPAKTPNTQHDVHQHTWNVNVNLNKCLPEHLKSRHLSPPIKVNNHSSMGGVEEITLILTLDQTDNQDVQVQVKVMDKRTKTCQYDYRWQMQISQMYRGNANDTTSDDEGERPNTTNDKAPPKASPKTPRKAKRKNSLVVPTQTTGELTNCPLLLETPLTHFQVSVHMTVALTPKFWFQQPVVLQRTWQHSRINAMHTIQTLKVDFGVNKSQFRVPHLTGNADWLATTNCTYGLQNKHSNTYSSELTAILSVPSGYQMEDCNFGATFMAQRKRTTGLYDSCAMYGYNDTDSVETSLSLSTGFGLKIQNNLTLELCARKVFIISGPAHWAQQQRTPELPLMRPSDAYMADQPPETMVTLVVGEDDRQSILVHRAVLMAHSDVFRTMLETDMMEKRTGVVQLPIAEAELWQEFITFCYTGQCDYDDITMLEDLMDLAEMYNMQALRTFTETASALIMCRPTSKDCFDMPRCIKEMADEPQRFSDPYAFVQRDLPELRPVIMQPVYRQLLESKIATDLVLRAGEKQFAVHEFVFHAGCNTFMKVVREQIDAHSADVDLSGWCDERELQAIIEHLYWDRPVAELFGEANFDDVVQLMWVTVRFGLVQLFEDCENVVMALSTKYSVAYVRQALHGHRMSKRMVAFLDSMPTERHYFEKPRNIEELARYDTMN